MLNELFEIVRLLPHMVHDCEPWDTLVINRRKPHTYRAFHIFKTGPFNGIRVCLHRFEACSAEEAFFHPHPWPSAMLVLRGHYKMRIGGTSDLKSPPPETAAEVVLAAGSKYSMMNPLGWHSVQPLTTCWSVMVNGAPWGAQAHEAAPTTKGKDLEKMSITDLDKHLGMFDMLLDQYLNRCV